MSQRLLYLDAHRLSAYAWQRGRLVHEADFTGDQAGQAAFSRYLTAHPNDRYRWLANVPGEAYAHETIPFLRGSDRTAVVSRKLGQHFQTTPLATAYSLGFEKTRRKNEKLLLTALTNPEYFAPWLDCLERAETRLAGMHTLAQLGGPLLRRLGLRDEHCLLLSAHDQSIRSTYIVRGRTHFSRLAPLVDGSLADIAAAFAAESDKLHKYLAGQRLIARDEALDVYIVAHPRTLPAIGKSCAGHAQLSYRLIDSHAAAQRINLRPPPPDDRADPLFLHLLASAPPRQQLAGAAQRHHDRIAQLRQALFATGLVALTVAAVFSAKQIHDARILRQEARQFSETEAILAQRYQTSTKTLPDIGVDNDRLLRLTQTYAGLAAHQRLPAAALARLGGVLERQPAIILGGLEWRNGQSIAENKAPPAGAAAPTVETTILHGTVNLPYADTRQILAAFDALREALAAQPQTTVRVLQPPFDFEPEHVLRGSGNTAEQMAQRPFALEIEYRRAP